MDWKPGSTYAVSGLCSACWTPPPHPSRPPHSYKSCDQVLTHYTAPILLAELTARAEILSYYTMKLALFIILTASLCPLLSNGGPYKLITGSLAKKTMGSNLRSWARSHAGIIASKSLASLLGTVGLLGSIELVNIARNSASDPDDQQALDSLLASLMKMK